MIVFERFHICSWEFKNGTSLVEFGGEIDNQDELASNELVLFFYINWLSNNDHIVDLFEKLKNPENSKFIFNESITGNRFLDGGEVSLGVVQEFSDRAPLCILPISSETTNYEHIRKIKINLKPLRELDLHKKTNIYFRFFIKTAINFISTRKNGISRSSIIYDFKINEKRNLPQEICISRNLLAKIKNCFCFHILPNSYDLAFFDNNSLKNIRTLEYDSFKKYLGDSRVEQDEYLVVFNKRNGLPSYNFFSTFKKERIGAGQFALAILVNIISGILLFIPTFRQTNKVSFLSKEFWITLPFEVYISLIIGNSIFLYFVWPMLVNGFRSVKKISR